MSVTMVLFLAAIATTVVLFADSAAQWSLRLILDEGADFSRNKTEATPAAPAEANSPAAHAA